MRRRNGMTETTETNNNGNSTEFSEMMKEFDLQSVSFDTPVNGKIIAISGQKVILDIGRKTEGILELEELKDWKGDVTHKEGDSITVILKRVNRKEGYIIVSKRELDKKEGWKQIQTAHANDETIEGRISRLLDDNKGFIVDTGIDMFLPLSHVDLRKVKNPKSLIGKVFPFKIIKVNQKEKSGVLSRRVLLENEKNQKIKEIFDTINLGDTVKGSVVSIMDYGAFVDIGGVDGLVYKENISYGRINHPKEKLKKGDEVEAKILEIDKENGKIALGIKQLTTDPWADIENKYPVGTKLVAKVLKTVDFGAFIELEEGIEGLLHISDLSWDEKPESVEGYVAVGDELWVQVIELNKKERKIKLGLKQLELRPEDKYIQTKKIGEVVSGVVKKILPSRVFVELEKNVEGVIKISDISYFRVESPREFLKEKETIDVMILDSDLDKNYKVKLGLKQLSDLEWKDFFKKNNPGNVIDVKVKKVNEFGISVEITKNIEGFVKLSEIDDNKVTYEEAQEMFKLGDEKEALILNTYPDKKRIYLSFQAVEKKREREEIEKYGKSDNESVTTIGELFENAIDKK